MKAAGQGAACARSDDESRVIAIPISRVTFPGTTTEPKQVRARAPAAAQVKLPATAEEDPVGAYDAAQAAEHPLKYGH